MLTMCLSTGYTPPATAHSSVMIWRNAIARFVPPCLPNALAAQRSSTRSSCSLTWLCSAIKHACTAQSKRTQ